MRLLGSDQQPFVQQMRRDAFGRGAMPAGNEDIVIARHCGGAGAFTSRICRQKSHHIAAFTRIDARTGSFASLTHAIPVAHHDAGSAVGASGAGAG